jgi:hypothetical protein
MKFIAFLRQEGGCDYTIDCGATLVELKSNTVEAATEELKKLIKEEYVDDNKLLEATIFGVELTVEIPLKEWYKKINKGRERSAREEGQRELYERLKRKYDAS